jgi:hypothetical protein
MTGLNAFNNTFTVSNDHLLPFAVVFRSRTSYLYADAGRVGTPRFGEKKNHALAKLNRRGA